MFAIKAGYRAKLARRKPVAPIQILFRSAESYVEAIAPAENQIHPERAAS
jgi:hypothetical protein